MKAKGSSKYSRPNPAAVAASVGAATVRGPSGAEQGVLFAAETFEPRVCARCDYQATGADARCPRCLGMSWKSGGEGAAWAPKKLSAVKRFDRERVPIGEPALDWFFNGGLVRGCSYYFTGRPGAGKSRWALQACAFAAFERPLYLSGEEEMDVVKLRAHDMGIKAGDVARISIVRTNDLDFVAKNITTDSDLVVLDSAHVFRTVDGAGTLGSATMTRAVLFLASDIARQLGQVWLIIGHVNADGEQAGQVANEHLVDACVRIECPDVKAPGRLLSFTGKHRHGPAERRVRCAMTGSGLDNFERAEDTPPEDAASS